MALGATLYVFKIDLADSDRRLMPATRDASTSAGGPTTGFSGYSNSGCPSGN